MIAAASDESVIEASGLAKRFAIHTRRERLLSSRVLSLFRGGHDETRPLWAVQGVDLRIQKGECLGVIGSNGAGKTTLLMLLAGLLAPTEGRLRVRGRVGPFFQIGSGLHHDLPVLDNIRLSAALFGMSRAETDRRIAAIVEFGELGDYLHARLGELSSGFQIRVPFSTALHADMDLLIMDELFAVGDARFQSKCMERLAALRQRGATVILASHDMTLIRSLCSRVVRLEHGRIVAQGDPATLAI